MSEQTLPTVELGDGLTTTVQGYGAMSLSDAYGAIDDEQAWHTLQHAVHAGITFIDSANIYGDGRSERTISRLFTGADAIDRDRVQVVSKVGILKVGGAGSRSVRGDRAYVREQIDGTLERLGTDHVDLYYQHRVDPEVPIEETVGAIAELVAEGKVRHIGLSEPTGDEIRRAAQVAPIAAVQTEYSIFARDVEHFVLPAVREVGAGFVPYSPLSRGLLTDDWRTLDNAAPNVRAIFPRLGGENLAINQGLVQIVADVAAEVTRARGVVASAPVSAGRVSVAQVALAWLYAKARELDVRISPIPGTRSPERIDENLGALDVVLDADQLRRLDALAAQVAGPRSANPGWTSQGREGLGND